MVMFFNFKTENILSIQINKPLRLINSISLNTSNLLSDISQNALSDLNSTSCHTQNVITPSVIRHQTSCSRSQKWTRLLAEIKAAGERSYNSSLNYPPHSQDNLNVTTGHWLLTNYLSAGQGRRARNSSVSRSTWSPAALVLHCKIIYYNKWQQSTYAHMRGDHNRMTANGTRISNRGLIPARSSRTRNWCARCPNITQLSASR